MQFEGQRMVTNECFNSEPDRIPLPDGEYVFSWYCTELAPVLVRRPWWNLWGRDRIELREQQTRKMLCGLPADEATVIRNASSRWHSNATGRLLTRMMGQKPEMAQLEADRPATAYVATGPNA